MTNIGTAIAAVSGICLMAHLVYVAVQIRLHSLQDYREGYADALAAVSQRINNGTPAGQAVAEMRDACLYLKKVGQRPHYQRGALARLKEISI